MPNTKKTTRRPTRTPNIRQLEASLIRQLEASLLQAQIELTTAQVEELRSMNEYRRTISDQVLPILPTVVQKMLNTTATGGMDGDTITLLASITPEQLVQIATILDPKQQEILTRLSRSIA